MADIDVEKKSPVWPWILAAVIIAIILLIIFIDSDPETVPMPGDEPISMVEPAATHHFSSDLPIIT